MVLGSPVPERLVSELLAAHRRRDALFQAGLVTLLRRSDRLLSRSEYAEYLRD